MEYTIKSFAKLAGISNRTLRYYDEIDLLKPKRINSSGYRIYGEEQVNTLQQIMLYKEMALPLESIRDILQDKSFHKREALLRHKVNLLQERLRLDNLIDNVEKSLEAIEGEGQMSNKDKFKGFKKELVNENERKYGKEARERYGDDKLDDSNRRIMALNEEEYNSLEELSAKVNKAIELAMKTKDSKSVEANTAVKLHKEWLNHYGDYSKEAHISLGEMYVWDSRFTSYYDEAIGEGAAQFLNEAIKAYYFN